MTLKNILLSAKFQLQKGMRSTFLDWNVGGAIETKSFLLWQNNGLIFILDPQSRSQYFPDVHKYSTCFHEYIPFLNINTTQQTNSPNHKI